jgi:anti-anti-sigma factor
MPIIPSPLSIRSEVAGTQVTVFLAGRADTVGADELKSVLARVAVRQPKRLVFDLTRLETLWSLVLGEMVGCARSVKRNGGKVEIVGASGFVRNVLITCRMDQVFEGLARDDATGVDAPASDTSSLN